MNRPSKARCRHCGSELKYLAAIQRVELLSEILFFWPNHGREDEVLEAGFSGNYDIIWETAKTFSYICSLCGHDLPEPVQRHLDRLLGITRTRIISMA